MPRNADKPLIAVDIDDVLAALAEKVVEYSNQKWGTQLTVDDYDDHWSRMWKISEAELPHRRDAVFSQYKYVNHLGDAVPVLNKLKQNYDLVIVTSRLRRVHDVTLEWLNRYYAGVFRELHYSDAWENENLHSDKKDKNTKTHVLEQIGADYLIDDYPKHCIAAAEAGITAILFGDYKWNRHVKLKKSMVRCKNWQEVLDYFERQGR